MKLYRVEISSEFYVVAVDENDAYMVASESVREAVSDADPDMWVSEVTTAKGLTRDWENAIPYGENPKDLTCSQVLFAPTPGKPSEEVGPVYWCQECLHERVQFDWREDRQLCPECRERTAAACS